MKIVYGAKILESEDLFKKCARPITIKDIKSAHREIIEAMGDTSIKIDNSYNTYTGFDVIFIPLPLVEEYMMYKAVNDAYMEVKNGTFCSRNSISKDINKVFLPAIKNKLDKNKKCFPPNKMYNSLCVTFIYNFKNRLIDCCLSVPRKIISKINKPIEYKCCKCGKINYTTDLPKNYYYKIQDNDINYYCEDCAKKGIGLAHVGDYSFNTI